MVLRAPGRWDDTSSDRVGEFEVIFRLLWVPVFRSDQPTMSLVSSQWFDSSRLRPNEGSWFLIVAACDPLGLVSPEGCRSRAQRSAISKVDLRGVEGKSLVSI